jgi:hypothetical protein
VTIVVREEISGPLRIFDARPGPCEPNEQPAAEPTMASMLTKT